MTRKFLSYLLLFSGLLLLSLTINNYAIAQTGIPDGSYKKTCRDIQIIITQLRAVCKKEDGSSQMSMLDYTLCEGDISNNNGKLTCKQKEGKKPPAGSYENSCKNIRVQDKKLKAQCEKRNGKWNNSSLNFKNCKGDISNDNGELTCDKGGEAKIPKGSYKDTCKDSYVEGKWLYSKCKKKNGNWNNTSLKYKDCNKDIKNDNGNLTCGGGDNSNYPKGSYKKSCKNLYMEGNLLEADCKNDNGKWKHSSIKYKNCNKGIWNDDGKLKCNK